MCLTSFGIYTSLEVLFIESMHEINECDFVCKLEGFTLCASLGLSDLAEPWSNKGGTLVKVPPGPPGLNIVGL